MKNVIELENVSMMFNLSKERVDNLKEYAIKLIKRELMFQEFWALRDISFQVKKGESIGLIGLNGSGKSTLLKIIAGVLKATTGNVKVEGSIAPLIELGAGFDMDLSARENIYLNGAILGYSRKEIAGKFEEIVDFAELWEFIDVPIKNFSSGMLARLGFSIATISQPDILIVDEILSVGDLAFQKKCEKRIAKMMENETTIILVSHSMEQIKEVCQKIVWLEKGVIREIGNANSLAGRYIEEYQ
ncbi:teichoic acid ABC transporter ATP-binding protein [Lachnospiraceae bacterium oral taxon 500]|nr:teichoic acid ABC transporter ATP-binding protein [Lachnospiraceae bacterium oral taxon 500]